MRIALCDDEARENENLQKLIEQCAFQKDLDLECEAFTDGNALLQRERFDLYFLDFCMETINGIDLAEALGKKFNRCVTICFLTNYETAAAESINRQIHADGFLKKPVDPVLLEKKLEQFYRMSFFNRFELKQGKRFQTVYAQDILYAEACNKQVKLHMFDRVESYNYLLRDLAQILPKELFFRIQRSFLVNLQYVDSYDAKSVTLKNGETLSMKAKDFQKAYHQFMFMMKN